VNGTIRGRIDTCDMETISPLTLHQGRLPKRYRGRSCFCTEGLSLSPIIHPLWQQENDRNLIFASEVVFCATSLHKTPHKKNFPWYCVPQTPLSEAVKPLASYVWEGASNHRSAKRFARKPAREIVKGCPISLPFHSPVASKTRQNHRSLSTGRTTALPRHTCPEHRHRQGAL